MQDFAGVRFDLGASHSVLLDIAKAIEVLVKQVNAEVTIKNYLSNPQRGYRAVHVWITSKPTGRVEIQLRTQLQAEWANTFEKLADLTGRRIRYEDDYRPANPELAIYLGKLARSLRQVLRHRDRSGGGIRISTKWFADHRRDITSHPSRPTSTQRTSQVLYAHGEL